MRLTCPNCDAQYEVDDSLIPPEGRDVQCSNCNTTWFQAGAGAEPQAPEPEPEPVQEPPEPEDEGADDAAMAAAAAIAGSATAPEPPSSKMDPDALNVIHEEVERETKAREAERGGLETQTDLGLDDVEDTEARASAARDRMDKRRGLVSQPEVEDTAEDPDPEPIETADAGAKSELLPDIEEINSTLADAPDPVVEEAAGQDPAQAVKSSRRGFRIGFGLILLIFAVLIGLYAYGSRVSETVPAAEAPLGQYRETIDSGRVWLDGAAQTLVEQINGLIGQISGN